MQMTQPLSLPDKNAKELADAIFTLRQKAKELKVEENKLIFCLKEITNVVTNVCNFSLVESEKVDWKEVAKTLAIMYDVQDAKLSALVSKHTSQSSYEKLVYEKGYAPS